MTAAFEEHAQNGRVLKRALCAREQAGACAAVWPLEQAQDERRALRYDSGMPKSASEIFELLCPCCGSTLRIDPELQVVIQHREPEKKPAIEDLQAAVQQLKGEADRRNDVFEKSFASHLSSEKVREKKFEELLKQAKEDKSGTPPKRAFDLD